MGFYMDMILNNEEVRVLGCLMEKKMATPEYYPLTLNALVNACNQKSNRDPLVAYDEETVLQAIDGLKKKQLALECNVSRAQRYEERFDRDRNFNSQEAAVMCILMLRGPQTAGEIRGRTERLCSFGSINEVTDTMENLTSLGLAVRMPRQAGQKEARYSHLMCGQPEEADHPVPVSQAPSPQDAVAGTARIELLEGKVAALSLELDDLKRTFQDFRRQFE
jgi:uncharacterized protein